MGTQTAKKLCNCMFVASACQETSKSSYPILHSVKQMKGFTHCISICTTTYFDGIIAVIDPELS
ncbi:hypothetical protein F5J12DRAFT_794747 [Pisolithus orientalis]|uniref:uncharacterized protein n=1 Tax=Pisolithus orientalis TaxID=936130 RepID=UPI0022251720|nr:uncharacterized protein F5J12DRAFT_794747 [Pisolithus orientalis]KAI6035625.1 hypothetical protein F5J12DRAFT_794747 [Pisolithus orientalis]